MEPDFFAIADRLCDLYITYRQRYVVMQAAPELEAGYRIYMPKSSSGPVKLTNRVVCRHLNRKLAISVFAGAYSSKFICFDVDYPDPFEVKKLIEILTGYGVPRDLIYVSTSGGKGYHVEIFFDGLVYTEQLRKFYDCVCVDGNFDPHKMEFRPTNGQAIKLPLSVHFKTGRVCWYLDRDTLQPIEDPAYVLQIQQMAVADFEKVLEILPPRKPFDMPENETVPTRKMKRADLVQMEGDGYPDLLEPGHRHNTMLSIGMYNRRRGLSQERNREELLAWAARQPEDFLLQSPAALERETDDIMRWVYSEQFVVASPGKGKPTVFNADDIAYWAAQPNRTCRKFMFLLRWKLKRHVTCQMSYDWAGAALGTTWKTVFDAVQKMVRQRQIDLVHGAAYMENGQLKRKPNKYYVAGSTPLPLPEGWTLQAKQVTLPEHLAEPTTENFMEVYSMVLQAMVPQARLKKIMGAKEYAEMQADE